MPARPERRARDTAAQGSLPQNGNTKGTQYLLGAFNYEIMPKLTFTATAGYTWVSNYNDLSYFDYKVGVTYDLAGWLLGANIIGTDADKQWWYAATRVARARTARSVRPVWCCRSGRRSRAAVARRVGTLGLSVRLDAIFTSQRTSLSPSCRAVS